MATKDKVTVPDLARMKADGRKITFPAAEHRYGRKEIQE
jgi:hypothetical protein